MRTEPAVIIGTITAVAVALLALLTSFGLPVDEDQQAALLAFIAVLAPIVAAFWTRSKVYAPASVTAVKARAYGDGVKAANDDRVPGPDHLAG